MSNQIYFQPLQQFATYFERAFNDNTFQEFGDTEEEKAFLLCVPLDFPDIKYYNKQLRWNYYIDFFLQTFNKYRNTNLTKEEVLPYIIQCKDYNY